MKDKLSKNMIIDLLMLVSMALTSISGFLIKFVLRRSTGISTVLGMGRHEWREIHLWAGIVLVLLLAVHIYQHWGVVDAWLRKRLPHLPARIAVYLILALLLAITVVPWLFMEV